MSTIIAQDYLMDPDRVDESCPHAPNCDGKEAIPPGSEVIQALVDSTDEEGIVLSHRSVD